MRGHLRQLVSRPRQVAVRQGLSRSREGGLAVPKLAQAHRMKSSRLTTSTARSGAMPSQRRATTVKDTPSGRERIHGVLDRLAVPSPKVMTLGYNVRPAALPAVGAVPVRRDR
jgi:hypothetical protein